MKKKIYAEKNECKGGGGGIGTLCLIEQNLFVHQLWWIVLNKKRVPFRYALSSELALNVLYKINISCCISYALHISPTIANSVIF